MRMALKICERGLVVGTIFDLIGLRFQKGWMQVLLFPRTFLRECGVISNGLLKAWPKRPGN